MQIFGKRILYLPYLLVYLIIAYWLSQKFNLTNNEQNLIGYIGTASELFGLSIAIIEIFVVNNLTKQIKFSISNIQALTQITHISEVIFQAKNDIRLKEYGKALIRLEQIKNTYHDNIDSNLLKDTQSSERKNIDKLESIITQLTLQSQSTKPVITNTKQIDFIEFLTKFSTEITTLKSQIKEKII